MKQFLMITTAIILTSTPAMAWVRVTNLSGKPQSVTYSHAGTQTTKVIAPDMTERFSGGEGMLALNDPETIAKAQNARPGPAGRLLGDLVASNRTSGIPATNLSSFVIWPDGRLLVQKHRDSHAAD